MFHHLPVCIEKIYQWGHFKSVLSSQICSPLIITHLLKQHGSVKLKLILFIFVLIKLTKHSYSNFQTNQPKQVKDQFYHCLQLLHFLFVWTTKSCFRMGYFPPSIYYGQESRKILSVSEIPFSSSNGCLVKYS